MKLKKFKISNLSEYPGNYNQHPEEQIEELKKSLTDFDQFKNIVVWNDKVIAGNGLVMAAKALGWTEIQAVDRSDLTEEQAKALLIADNALPFGGLPDIPKLESLIGDIDFDIPGVTDDFLAGIGVGDDFLSGDGNNELSDKYTQKIEAPIYEITGEKPGISDIVNTDKRDELIRQIEKAEIPKETKEFLKEAANRHIVFDYRNIAEFYAHSPKEVQALMEKSALVIIDFDKAIEFGYAKLSDEIYQQYKREHPEK